MHIPLGNGILKNIFIVFKFIVMRRERKPRTGLQPLLPVQRR